MQIQWGSEIQPFEIQKHLKNGHLMIRFQIVQFLNGWALAMSLVPNIWKLDRWKSGCFCLDFKWFWTKWQPFVRISNGWASRFQIPFKIQTICNPTSFWPFKIQTLKRLDFECVGYLNVLKWSPHYSNEQYLEDHPKEYFKQHLIWGPTTSNTLYRVKTNGQRNVLWLIWLLLSERCCKGVERPW